MELLLDTHTALWWWRDSPRLSAAAREALAAPSSTIYFSAASAMEIATKARLGKLEISKRLARDLAGAVALSGWRELGLTVRHAQQAGAMDWSHRDPFDRLLVSQASLENLILVTNDGIIEGTETKTLW